MGVSVSVGHASIASARGGALFSTAASTLLASRARPVPPPPPAPAAPASGGPLIAPWDQPPILPATATAEPQQQAAAAFLLDFVSQPQDGSADAALELLIAPSFVSYSPSALTSIRAFFAHSGGSEGLQLTTLQVCMSVQKGQMQRGRDNLEYGLLRAHTQLLRTHSQLCAKRGVIVTLPFK